MGHFFKGLFISLLSISIGAAVWYLIGVILTGGERNILLWPLWGRIIYVIFTFATSTSLIDSYNDNSKTPDNNEKV